MILTRENVTVGGWVKYVPQRAPAAPTDIERWREAKSDEWAARGDTDEAFAYLSGARDDEADTCPVMGELRREG